MSNVFVIIKMCTGNDKSDNDGKETLTALSSAANFMSNEKTKFAKVDLV